jgi:hypothetical protein
MKTLKNYLRQPSTWLGLTKLGAAFGLYSTGVGGAIGTAVMGVFGLLDVLRNEGSSTPFDGPSGQ